MSTGARAASSCGGAERCHGGAHHNVSDAYIPRPTNAGQDLNPDPLTYGQINTPPSMFPSTTAHRPPFYIGPTPSNVSTNRNSVFMTDAPPIPTTDPEITSPENLPSQEPWQEFYHSNPTPPLSGIQPEDEDSATVPNVPKPCSKKIALRLSRSRLSSKKSQQFFDAPDASEKPPVPTSSPRKQSLFGTQSLGTMGMHI